MDDKNKYITEYGEKIHVYAPLSRIAEALAQRWIACMTDETAYKALHNNGYLRINSNDIEYKPPRDIEGSRHLYYIHLSVEFGEIIEKLIEKKIIPIYNPTTLLPTNYNQIKPEPVAYLDEVGKLINEFKKNEISSEQNNNEKPEKTMITGWGHMSRGQKIDCILEEIKTIGHDPKNVHIGCGRKKGTSGLVFDELNKKIHGLPTKKTFNKFWGSLKPEIIRDAPTK